MSVPKIAGIDPKTGVTKELKGVAAWNPILAGIVTAWHDPQDGQSYVINGHHRAELAHRAIGKPLSELMPGMEHDPAFDDGNGNYNGAMQVMYLDAADAQSARAMGALSNIAEGRGTAPGNPPRRSPACRSPIPPQTHSVPAGAADDELKNSGFHQQPDTRDVSRYPIVSVTVTC